MKQWGEIIQVPLPLPFALKMINAYIIKGSRGCTIIDTGLHTEEDLEMWKQAQTEYGWNWKDVEKIVLTHYHPDHYGLAGTLQELTGAPVYISETDKIQARIFLDRESDMPEIMADFYSKHGLDKEWTAKISGHLRSFYRWVEPHPRPSLIGAGDTIQLGDREYTVYHTPGHADGHLSFFDPERGWLIGGDFLLPKITPNISLWPRCNPNPLKTYLDTLEKMKDLPVKKVFPSHGRVFEHYRERIDELKRHHEERLQKMKEWIAQADGATAFEVCTYLFGTSLSIHNLRFALAETLAHLEYLRLSGELNRMEEKEKFVYHLS
ncbi:MBL fold metallo-hydrolase [Paenactinomyces guangxiensis]|uniref:MBL fold metallo-hydrolase n=1 Tax=Paenactinomyces guangxiensis TaxID=1490290 RepID=A0A7W2A7M1_9BACL|nr:MBL fold metallo-hydrolase [Paenactinomyces guangxiensis]MBA4493715.1 MBL fold metallo-hydrolase [Paenactinomyces guangxiensis]MBH8591002.1 MBL fold metallo-hydrolase [Paenactinomyces guangxiensis]